MGRAVSRQQTANQRTISNTIGHKKSPLGKVQAGIRLNHPDYGGLLARIRPTALILNTDRAHKITRHAEIRVRLLGSIAGI